MTHSDADTDGSKQEPTNKDQSPIGSVKEDSAYDRPAEHGGPKGPEPTRYGDWEKNGRCSDF